MEFLHCPNCNEKNVVPVVYEGPTTEEKDNLSTALAIDYRSRPMLDVIGPTHTCRSCHRDLIRPDRSSALNLIIVRHELVEILDRFRDRLLKNLEDDKNLLMEWVRHFRVKMDLDVFNDKYFSPSYLECNKDYLKLNALSAFTRGYHQAFRYLITDLSSLAKADTLYFDGEYYYVPGPRDPGTLPGLFDFDDGYYGYPKNFPEKKHPNNIDGIRCVRDISSTNDALLEIGKDLERHYGALVLFAANATIDSLENNSKNIPAISDEEPRDAQWILNAEKLAYYQGAVLCYFGFDVVQC